MRCSSAPGRTSTRSWSWPGCTCRIQGSWFSTFSISPERSIGSCHSCKASGTCRKRSGAKASKTEFSWRREVKRHRVPRAVVLPVMSSHVAGNFWKMALPEFCSGSRAVSTGTSSRPCKFTGAVCTCSSRRFGSSTADRPVSGTSCRLLTFRLKQLAAKGCCPARAGLGNGSLGGVRDLPASNIFLRSWQWTLLRARFFALPSSPSTMSTSAFSSSEASSSSRSFGASGAGAASACSMRSMAGAPPKVSSNTIWALKASRSAAG
mmetsp:Transcript_37594/g.89780  ORF Transcript_37594/g.89780 Transcript_37594/m.89780 type:complete len:264 (-) Transcript_37594:19-810(-)